MIEFNQYLERYDWQEVRELIAAQTPANVRQALNKPKLTVEDFLILLSPAADRIPRRNGATFGGHHSKTLRTDHPIIRSVIPQQ